MKVMFVMGTRPEVIKLAPVLLEARRRGLETVCVVTAQHREMLDMMMDVWELRADHDHDLDLMKPGQTMCGVTSEVLRGLDGVIEDERPEAVDAGTVAMAGVDPDRVYDVVRMLLRGGHVYDRMSKAISPYGDGLASQRIVEILRKSVENT